MRIVIVGAGLGGLSAALCFAKHGHSVLVLEQRPSLSNQGSGINIRPGASRILHSWGLRKDLEKIGDETPSVLLRDLRSGEIVMNNILVDASETPDWGTQRSVVVKLLYDKAIEAGAEASFGSSVIEVSEDAEKASLVLADGRNISADLVLAADGIRSKIRPKILSDVITSMEPLVSDTTFYGLTLDAHDVSAQGKVTAPLFDMPALNVWMGHNAFVVGRHNRTLKSWGGLFGIKSETDQKSLWDEDGDIEYVRKALSGSCPELMTVLNRAKTCDRWKLAEMPNLPRWTSPGGRIALLGDSAHGMHPNAAQGFSMIVEDIGVLNLIISRTINASANVPDITDTWQRLRKPRVERIKEYAKWNTSFFLGEPLAPKGNVNKGETVRSLRHAQPDMGAKFASHQFVKWTLDFDAIGEAEKYLDGAKAKM